MAPSAPPGSSLGGGLLALAVVRGLGRDEVAHAPIQHAHDRARLGEAATRGIAATGAEAGPLVGQRRVGCGPAVVEPADEGRVRHPGVRHENFVEQGAARHLLEGTDVHPVLEHVEGEVRNALMLRHFRVGARQQHAEVGVLAARCPHLLPVDDPLVAVLHGTRLQAGQVGPGLGLAEELAPRLLPGDDVADVEVDLLLGAVRGDRRRRQEEPQSGRGTERTEVADLLGDEDGVGAGHRFAVGVARQTRGRPTGEAEALPPLGHRQVGVPVALQPTPEVAEQSLRAGRFGRGVGHATKLPGASGTGRLGVNAGSVRLHAG